MLAVDQGGLLGRQLRVYHDQLLLHIRQQLRIWPRGGPPTEAAVPAPARWHPHSRLQGIRPHQVQGFRPQHVR